MLVGLLLSACDLIATGQASQAAPDIEATVTAAVQAALAAQAKEIAAPENTSILSSDEAKEFILQKTTVCRVAWQLSKVETEARYIADNVWLVSLKGQIGNLPFNERIAGMTWSAGRWRLNELTGDLQPYDLDARGVEEQLVGVCLELLPRP